MPTVELTKKQLAFAREIASGKTQIDAYKATYDCNNMAVPTIRQAAHREYHKPEVKKHIKIMRDKFDDVYAIERTKDDRYIRAIIYKRLEECFKAGNDSAIARYTDQLNKMNGVYNNIEKNEDNSADMLKDLSAKELKELIGKL